MLTSQFLALGLGRIKQPKVVSEILAGIILGTLYHRYLFHSEAYTYCRSHRPWTHPWLYAAHLP